jgi:hypothetical protein
VRRVRRSLDLHQSQQPLRRRITFFGVVAGGSVENGPTPAFGAYAKEVEHGSSPGIVGMSKWPVAAFAAEIWNC